MTGRVKTAPDGAPLVEQSTGGALKVGGAHKRAGGLKGYTEQVREQTRGDVLKRLKAMKRIVDHFDRYLLDAHKAGVTRVPDKRKPIITAGDAIKAFNTLVDLSGLKVIKVAETDEDGNDRREFDERALQAILASRNRLN